MAFQHGSGAHITVDDSGGTPRDISAYETDIDWSYTSQTHETQTFGDSSVERSVGLKDSRLRITGLFDATAAGYLAGRNGVAGTFIFGPMGSTGGDVKYTGESICSEYTETASVGDMVKATATFVQSGAVSVTTF